MGNDRYKTRSEHSIFLNILFCCYFYSKFEKWLTDFISIFQNLDEEVEMNPANDEPQGTSILPEKKNYLDHMLNLGAYL